jgi:hypothetical protein
MLRRFISTIVPLGRQVGPRARECKRRSVPSDSLGRCRLARRQNTSEAESRRTCRGPFASKLQARRRRCAALKGRAELGASTRSKHRPVARQMRSTRAHAHARSTGDDRGSRDRLSPVHVAGRDICRTAASEPAMLSTKPTPAREPMRIAIALLPRVMNAIPSCSENEKRISGLRAPYLSGSRRDRNRAQKISNAR